MAAWDNRTLKRVARRSLYAGLATMAFGIAAALFLTAGTTGARGVWRLLDLTRPGHAMAVFGLYLPLAFLAGVGGYWYTWLDQRLRTWIRQEGMRRSDGNLPLHPLRRFRDDGPGLPRDPGI